MAAPDPATVFPLRPPIPIPGGLEEDELRAFLDSVRVEGARADELARYAREDFWRFVRTFTLVPVFSGRVLELGANPYFTTMLLRQFTQLELTLANFFEPSHPDRGTDIVAYKELRSGKSRHLTLEYDHFNVEEDAFPYEDDSFDVVLFCEIVEHLLNDPLAALREINRVLAPGGILILTTPNVNRLENVVAMVAGANVYDPYSGYGPYGRHNREFNKHELHELLMHAGFEPDALMSADVHENRAGDHMDWSPLVELLEPRRLDLGQYLFARAYNRLDARRERPSFLYRSYPEPELVRA